MPRNVVELVPLTDMSDDLLTEINNTFTEEFHTSRRTREQMAARGLGRVIRAFEHSADSDLHQRKAVNPMQIMAQNMGLDKLTAHAVRVTHGQDKAWAGMTMARRGMRLYRPIFPKMPLPTVVMEQFSPVTERLETPRTHVNAWVTAAAMGMPGVLGEAYDQMAAERLPHSNLWTTEPIASTFAKKAIEDARFEHWGRPAHLHVCDPNPLPDFGVHNWAVPPLGRLYRLSQL